jgi:hypothetical protein
MAAHTPGPWVTTCRKTGGDWELHDPTGRCVGTAVEMDDARLIAAAPDLLAALYVTSNCAPITAHLATLADDAEITLGFTAADIRQIRAAIAKAEGH